MRAVEGWKTCHLGNFIVLHGQRITIIPHVDSCSGDEFMPDYCRIRERNEANNEMRRSLTLP